MYLGVQAEAGGGTYANVRGGKTQTHLEQSRDPYQTAWAERALAFRNKNQNGKETERFRTQSDKPARLLKRHTGPQGDNAHDFKGQQGEKMATQLHRTAEFETRALTTRPGDDTLV